MKGSKSFEGGNASVAKRISSLHEYLAQSVEDIRQSGIKFGQDFIADPVVQQWRDLIRGMTVQGAVNTLIRRLPGQTDRHSARILGRIYFALSAVPGAQEHFCEYLGLSPVNLRAVALAEGICRPKASDEQPDYLHRYAEMITKGIGSVTEDFRTRTMDLLARAGASVEGLRVSSRDQIAAAMELLDHMKTAGTHAYWQCREYFHVSADTIRSWKQGLEKQNS